MENGKVFNRNSVEVPCVYTPWEESWRKITGSLLESWCESAKIQHGSICWRRRKTEHCSLIWAWSVLCTACGKIPGEKRRWGWCLQLMIVITDKQRQQNSDTEYLTLQPENILLTLVQRLQFSTVVWVHTDKDWYFFKGAKKIKSWNSILSIWKLIFPMQRKLILKEEANCKG